MRCEGEERQSDSSLTCSRGEVPRGRVLTRSTQSGDLFALRAHDMNAVRKVASGFTAKTVRINLLSCNYTEVLSLNIML